MIFVPVLNDVCDLSLLLSIFLISFSLVLYASRDLHNYQTWRKTFSMLQIILSSLSFVLNLAIILIFIYTVLQKRLKRVNFLFCVQALTDSCVNVSMVLWFTSNDKNNHMTNESSKIKWFSYDYSLFLAGLNLIFMTTERYIAIKYPFQHRTHVTFKVLCFIVFGIFLLAAIPPSVLIAYILPMFAYEDKHINRHYETIYYSTKGVIGLMAILYIYTLLFLSYRKIRISNRNQSLNSSSRRYTSENKNRMKFIIMVLIMSSLYALTILPGALYMFIFNKMNEATRGTFQTWFCETWLNIFYFLTALLNAILTITFQDDYFNVLFYCMLVKRGESEGRTSERRTATTSSTQEYMVNRRVIQMQRYA